MFINSQRVTSHFIKTNQMRCMHISLVLLPNIGIPFPLNLLIHLYSAGFHSHLTDSLCWCSVFDAVVRLHSVKGLTYQGSCVWLRQSSQRARLKSLWNACAQETAHMWSASCLPSSVWKEEGQASSLPHCRGPVVLMVASEPHGALEGRQVWRVAGAYPVPGAVRGASP